MRSKRATFAGEAHDIASEPSVRVRLGLDSGADVPQGFRRRLYTWKVLDLGLESPTGTAVGFSGAFHSWETHCYL
ncbi:unnamed protein product [Ectocarpus fasciculatus]